MSNAKSKLKEDKPVTPNFTTDLAVTRTVMAADRSMMAWVRTGLSLITFGFTIYKFLDYAREELIATGKEVTDFSSPKIIGLFLIGLGILSLLMGIIENEATIRVLKKNHSFNRMRYSLFISLILLVFGVILFLAVLLKT